MTEDKTETIRVGAPVDDPDIPVWSEVMAAAPDPADRDQAVLLNVPFLVDRINFGDLVRLGPPDVHGVRPITSVAVASGHVRMLAATEPGDAMHLAAVLEDLFQAYALRVEMADERLLSISVHPDIDPGTVRAAVEDWLADGAEDEEEGLAIGPLVVSEPGALDR